MNRRYLTLFVVALVALLAPVWALYEPRVETPQQASVAVAAQLAHIPKEAPLSLIVEPDDGISMLLEAIERAVSSVDLVIYELDDPAILEALADAHDREVAVRVILENVNSFGRRPNQRAYDFLSSRRVPVMWAQDYFALSHQKTLIVDQKIAYIMTFNLMSKYYPTSRDFGLINEDSVDVAAIAAAFDSDWKGKEETASRGRDLLWSPGSRSALLSLINGAQDTLDVYALLMADPEITLALEAAAARGVVVRVVMTYATNWKPVLNELTQKGVIVRTFASTADTFIHAKVIVADGARAFVGSENFSAPSLDQNRELGMLISRDDILEELESTFARDFAAARPYRVRE